MKRYIETLIESGVARTEPLTADGADDAIGRLDHIVRAEAPGRMPALDLGSARWAFCQLHTACLLAVDRSDPPEQLARRFELSSVQIGQTEIPVSSPVGLSASIAYSVDLALRYLPDVYGEVERALRNDPLLGVLREVVRPWPLSSVGVPNVPVAVEHLDPVGRDPFLRAVYIDRVIERSDTSRYEVRWVQDGVEAALGYPFPKSGSAESKGANA